MEIRGVKFRVDREWRVGALYYPSGAFNTAAVLMLHGFPGVCQNEDIAIELCRRGMTVFLPHFRGSWGSGGEFSVPWMFRDAESALNLLSRYRFVDRSRIGLLGYSVGGWVALKLAAQRKVSAVAVMAPAVPLGNHPGDPEYLKKNSRVLTIPDLRKIWSEYSLAAETDRPETYIPRIAPTPLLFVQGRHDQLAPPQATSYLWSLAENPKEFIHMEEEDHTFQIDRKRVISSVCGWMESRLRPVELSLQGAG